MNYIEFSLILATYGRCDEVRDLMHSLRSQTIGSDLFEIILLDQNPTDDLDELISEFPDLKITHIRSRKKGLSYNRNVGISLAKGKYLAFPDDDCTYYTDTLQRALQHLKKTNAPMVLGAIRDRRTGESMIKNWPDSSKNVTRWNVQRFSTSINIFCENRYLKFREDLGAGTYNGSCEDLEFVYKTISKFGKIPYQPDIEVWHPAPDISDIPCDKVASYARGFGRFCRIYCWDTPVLFLFVLAITYHAIQAVVKSLLLDFNSAKKRLVAIRLRMHAFILGKPNLTDEDL